MSLEQQPATESAQQGTRVRLPLARPILTNVLLVIIILVFLAETFFSGTTDINTRVLVALGAQANILITEGEYWRLLAAMFLHVHLMHLAFNAWALYSLGREVESLYGTPRFAIIYFLSGLAGGVAFYLLGEPMVPSAGASGAIFGLIGANIAYFLRNRRVFGHVGRRQLGNLATLVVINLILGFTIPGINNLAHMGGLAGGLALGLGLTPLYAIRWEGLIPSPRLFNRNPLAVQLLVVALALALLLAGLWLKGQGWAMASAIF